MVVHNLALLLIQFDQLSEWYPRASKTTWRKFWASHLPQRAHTIWWRIFHKKLPCKQCLHQLVPRIFTSPNCIFCNEIDTPEHFLWECSQKRLVWQDIANRFLVLPDQLEITHITSLSASALAVREEFKFDSFCLIATTLLHLWRAHWRFVFHQETFWPHSVSAHATLHLRKIHAEETHKIQSLR
ncbi:hypothetical protein BDC45DRAFT_573855 [Circinella umbellata]|nr:hypothetical protein BDC45DRAFT_573855 [Circinella umbellata]